MALTANDLQLKYLDTVTQMISSIKEKKQGAIPGILVVISTELVPSMMVDVGKIKGFTGAEKRTLIIDSVKLVLRRAFSELNRIPALAEASWDEMVRDILLNLLPPLIKLLIDVDNNDIKFNKKVKGCFGCCL